MASAVSWKGISRARAEGVAVSDDKSACGFDFLHDFVSVLLLALGLCSVIVNTQLRTDEGRTVREHDGRNRVTLTRRDTTNRLIN